jgi:class 3 adenylate cyclase
VGQSRTIALLFTDLVGSTELSTRLGREGADRLRRAHFALLREALDEAGGQEVKSLGDGLMVAFGSVGAAVAGAVGMQQRIEQRNRTAAPPLAVRIGVAVGDALREERDWFGPPAVEAARLCAAAGGA